MNCYNRILDKYEVLSKQHKKVADYIIDLGPGGGEHGGFIIAEGTPEKISKSKKSLTGQYLKTELNRSFK